MEVFPKYFRRLLVGNAPQIFPGINKAVENPGNYPLLVGELRKITQDPEQARRIADAIDTADGDLFKNFDLATFLDHFNLTSIETVLLALAFETSARPDLSSKGTLTRLCRSPCPLRLSGARLVVDGRCTTDMPQRTRS